MIHSLKLRPWATA